MLKDALGLPGLVSAVFVVVFVVILVVVVVVVAVVVVVVVGVVIVVVVVVVVGVVVVVVIVVKLNFIFIFFDNQMLPRWSIYISTSLKPNKTQLFHECCHLANDIGNIVTATVTD